MALKFARGIFKFRDGQCLFVSVSSVFVNKIYYLSKANIVTKLIAVRNSQNGFGKIGLTGTELVPIFNQIMHFLTLEVKHCQQYWLHLRSIKYF